MTTSDGDGTVPEISLTVCGRWRDQRNVGFAVNVTTYKGVDHAGMIQNAAVIKDVIAILKET